MVLKSASKQQQATHAHRMLQCARLVLMSGCLIGAVAVVSFWWMASSVRLVGASGSSQQRGRMVRLCIASVDPNKLSSQCVMCNRREFPLTVIDCTGFSKMNDLIANPLSVQDATCLVYNCRRQVPDIRPEPYHGTAAVRANYPSASGIRNYEILPPANPYHQHQHQHPAALMGAGHQSSATIMRFHPPAYAHSPPMHYVPAGYAEASSSGRHLQLPYAAIIPGSYAPPSRFSPYDY